MSENYKITFSTRRYLYCNWFFYSILCCVQSTYPMKKYHKKKVGADGEMKIPRWERREKKKGPPK